MTTQVQPCSGCSLLIEGGTAGCQRIFDELTARSVSDLAYGRLHRMLVDTYCLQHPDRYCVSATSLAAHLTGLCWLVERNGDRALGNDQLRRWLNSKPAIAKPEIPPFRGALTVESFRHARDAGDYERQLERWARTTWDAY